MIGRCLLLTGNTPNTTRFQGRDQYETAVAVSQAVWANPADPMMRPGAVMLARGDGMCYQDALVSSPLMHFPRNGPVLLTEPTHLNPVVREEILRLSPTGKSAPAQVLTIGSLSMSVDEEVRRLGFTVCRVGGPDPVATAVAVWDIVGAKRQVMLVSGERFEEALPAAGWAAHMEDPILLAGRDYLPPATACAIRQTQPDVYILGGPGSVSTEVERAVRGLTCGFVDRICGRDAFETAINFTRYCSPTGKFGWCVREKRGWGFRFARYDRWYGGISGNPLSHMGKHAPLLLVEPDLVPPSVEEYILSVNPRHLEPKPPYMHGFLVGTVEDIACPVQWRLESLLTTVDEHG
ncbi:MAG: cell wall-binding repeat-containing protein [Firmicutes bacterium]|nr:cell wall-binding repeat-containing protein [Bacillota bacterium]